MYHHFPAVIIGGPPHSGKSVLTISLTEILREWDVPHYVLRACPDGEGDWSNWAEQELVRELRDKGNYTDTFVRRVTRHIRTRHYPLLVDVGGRPTKEQEALYRHCTDAILLIADGPDYEQELAVWQERIARYDLTLIGQLRSVLGGQNRLQAAEPIVQGMVTDLERGRRAQGATFQALCQRLRQLFAYDADALAEWELQQAPSELGLNLASLADTLQVDENRWQPADLPRVSAYLPQGKPLSIYGRGPNWLYALLGWLAHPAPFNLFNPRSGWIAVPHFPLVDKLPAQEQRQQGWDVTLTQGPDYTILTLSTDAQILDETAPERLPILTPPPGRGVVLSGQIPHWLVTGLVRQLAPRLPWVAVYQPPLNAAVVVASQVPEYHLGQTISEPI